MTNLKEVKPSGFLVRFPVYIEGPNSAHIILAPSSTVTANDDAYEIIIGGWLNTRSEIRKRLDGAVLAAAETPNILSLLKKKKFVVEITDEGFINVFSEDNPNYPFITAVDPKPAKIEFVGFKGYEDAVIKYFFDYRPQLDTDKLLANLLPAKYDLVSLKRQCSAFAAANTEFQQFHSIAELGSNLNDQGVKTFSFYVDGTKDASLVLASSATPDPKTDTVYEICKCLIGNLLRVI